MSECERIRALEKFEVWANDEIERLLGVVERLRDVLEQLVVEPVDECYPVWTWETHDCGAYGVACRACRHAVTFAEWHTGQRITHHPQCPVAEALALLALEEVSE